MTTRSVLGNAIRATVLVGGRAEIHLRFNNYTELDQAYRELDALAGKPSPAPTPSPIPGSPHEPRTE